MGNGWFRLHHYVELYDPEYKADYELISLDPQGKESTGRKTIPDEEKKIVYFKRTSDFKA